MRYLLLPFYLSLLIPTVSFSMAKISLIRASFLASGIGCVLFLLYVLTFQAALPSLPAWSWLTTPPSATTITLPQTDNTTRYQEDLEVWLALYKLQPTHRDVLVNLAVLSELLGDTQAHDDYWAEAQHLDPNNAVFSSN